MNAGDLGPFLHKELVVMLCGEHLGGGIARQVFAHALDPTLVVKFEGTGGSFQNVLEWETWYRVKGTKLERWFAPCVAISPCGGVLVQRRTTVPGASEFPDRLPSFLTDTKRANFGMLDGQLVAHDYGYNLLMEKGMVVRMKKARWWNGSSYGPARTRG
jgi:hypothetical protein